MGTTPILASESPIGIYRAGFWKLGRMYAETGLCCQKASALMPEMSTTEKLGSVQCACVCVCLHVCVQLTYVVPRQGLPISQNSPSSSPRMLEGSQRSSHARCFPEWVSLPSTAISPITNHEEATGRISTFSAGGHMHWSKVSIRECVCWTETGLWLANSKFSTNIG